MKQCPYCGKLYPDDATVCAIDQAPLKETPLGKSQGVSGAFIAVPLGLKIPVSLKIVSYVFLLPAIVNFIFVISLVGIISKVGIPTEGAFLFLTLICFYIAQGVFWFFLSRGLRRCSRGWRVCALVIIWLGFIATVINIARFLLFQRLPSHETPISFGVACALGFILLAWQYWVLTRPDIRDLFHKPTQPQNGDQQFSGLP